MSITLDALDFDPYRDWLNVTERERPVAPYELLSLTPLESDPNRIRAGYLRQQSTMLKYAERADPKVWESVNREIEDAYALLSDPEQKAVLDAAIRRKSGGGPNGKPASTSSISTSAAAGVTVICRHCQRTSPASKRFCGGCGQSLWEICPECQTECAAEERFCGTCGADILGGLSQQSRELQQKLDEAHGLVAEHRYDAAISCLRSVAAVSDPRFEKWAQQALSEISRTEQHRADQRTAANESLARAKRQFQAHAYDAAIAELDQIPEPLRWVDVTMLLARARGARQEILSVTAEIRAALDEKRTSELLPKIDRLLTLQPDHKQILQLAEQLRDRLVRRAKKHFLAYQYRECLDQLEQVSSFVCTKEVETLREAAGELLALFDGVRNAPLADRPTLGLADMLVRLAPANEEASRLRAQLAERVQSRPADAWLGAANFAPTPQRTPFGAPVDWLAHSKQFQPADERVALALREHPGQFFVALGLALQGLGLAAVPIDLLPPEKISLLARPLFARKFAGAWGLDLSDEGLKAVRLTRETNDGPVQVTSCEYILHRKSLSLPEAEAERPEIVDETLRDFLSRAGDLKSSKICVGITGQRVLGRFFEVPPLPAKKLADAIAYEARHQLPISLDELCWGSHVLDPRDGTGDNQPRRIMVTAAREPHIRERAATFKSVGINVDQVQSDCVALHNALVFELFGQGGDDAKNAAICTLDIGTQCTNVVISSPETVWFRTFGQGGYSFLNLLIKEFNLTYQQAEQIKREPAKARRYGQMCDALRPIFVQLASEIERSLANYGKLYPDHPVKQIYGLGGAFQTHGLLKHLRLGK